MRNVGHFVMVLTLGAVACESPQGSSLLGPTPIPTPSATSTPVSPRPPAVLDRQLDDATRLEIGETVQGQITTSDPLCDPTSAYAHRCRYFKVTAPHAGLLHVTLRWGSSSRDPYPLDIAVYTLTGGEWLPAVGPGTQRRVDVVVESGGTALVEVWSFLTPGEPFELTSSLEPR